MKPEVKNGILGVVVVALIAVAGYRIFGGSSEKGTLPSDYTVEGVCLACKAEARLTQSLGIRPPFQCSGCSKQAVYPWMFCPECKHRFIPKLEPRPNGPPGYPVIPACAKCGGARGTGFDSKDPEQKPVGDAPLPAMP